MNLAWRSHCESAQTPLTALPPYRLTALPLTPKHVVTFDGIIEEEEAGQAALELNYIGRQALAEDPYRTVSRRYVLVGLLAMKRLGSRATVFVNAENLLDVQLGDYQPLVRPEPGAGGAVGGGRVGAVGGEDGQPGGSFGAALLDAKLLRASLQHVGLANPYPSLGPLRHLRLFAMRSLSGFHSSTNLFIIRITVQIVADLTGCIT